MKKSLGAKTLAFPTPVWCVGSYDKQGRPNIMTIAWGGICCSKPPAATVSLRKNRYTYHNIMDKGAFTINIPPCQYVKEVDYFGMASGKSQEKFKTAGLTAVKAEQVDAPYVKEFPMVLECRLMQTHEIGLHTQFIGEILDVKVDTAALDTHGLPDMRKVAPFIYAPEVQAYYAIGEMLGKAFETGKHLG